MFRAEIVTPERIAFSDKVDLVTVPSTMGQLTILPHHTPLFAQLVQGELRIKQGLSDHFLSIGGGFIEVTFEKTTILVTKAIHATELNEQEILRAKKAAEESLKEKPTSTAFQSAQALLRSSLIDLKVLKRKRRIIKTLPPRQV